MVGAVSGRRSWGSECPQTESYGIWKDVWGGGAGCVFGVQSAESYETPGEGERGWGRAAGGRHTRGGGGACRRASVRGRQVYVWGGMQEGQCPWTPGVCVGGHAGGPVSVEPRHVWGGGVL